MSSTDLVLAAAGAAGESTYVEDVFSTYLYTGNGSSQNINNGIALANGPANGTVLQLTGDTLTDSAPVPNTITNNGSVSVSTSVKQYGNGSLSFSGSNSLTLNSSVFNFGTDNFTIEFWINPNAWSGAVLTLFNMFTIYRNNSVSTSKMGLRFADSSNSFEGSDFFSTADVPVGSWSFWALVKNGSTYTWYCNGVSSGTFTNATSLSPSGNAEIGFNSFWGIYLNGYIDDLRITKGIARYTANFTPPTAALPLDTLVTGKGGMFWIKRRNGAESHYLLDTARGDGSLLNTNTTDAAGTGWGSSFEFNNNGFSVSNLFGDINGNGKTYASWTFRKAPKFFDVVTYTGNLTARTIAHNLGSVPGMIIVKRTDAAEVWAVYHRSLGSDKFVLLNSTAAQATSTTAWNNTAPTSTNFSVGVNGGTNQNGGTYVAYLFAHDAGGFGAAGTDNIISCGSFTTDGSGNATVSLGYEPQYLIIKASSDSANWAVVDVMRGASETSVSRLIPNSSGAESIFAGPPPSITPTATGFKTNGFFSPSVTLVYMAIRRPMKVPTDATTVFGTSYGTTNIPSFPISNFTSGVDCAINFYTPGYDDGTNAYPNFNSRLQGTGQVQSPNTRAEIQISNNKWDYMNGYYGLGGTLTNLWGSWLLARRPNFFDIVCYTGTGSARTVTHNLGVAPELIIVKKRNGAESWCVYSAPTGNTQYLFLNTTNAAASTISFWNNTTPTASVFSLSSTAFVNGSGDTYVAYLFASCPGVSKVGSYTGNGSNQTIDCGFTNGARFVLVKATSTTGDWVVLDTARGIVSGNDPFLQLNSTAAEVTNEDIVDPANSGFIVNSTTEAINTNGVTYIYLAIA